METKATNLGQFGRERGDNDQAYFHRGRGVHGILDVEEIKVEITFSKMLDIILDIINPHMHEKSVENAMILDIANQTR